MAARIGLVGLAVMGANLALNIAEKGFPIAVFNRSASRTDAFMTEDAGDLAERITPTKSYEELVASLSVPRAIIVMVKAGEPVDQVIAELEPLLSPGDMIIDCGNANFHDTRRREAALREKGLSFIGMGVSGGEEGARHGPAMMAGGKKESFDVIRDIVEAIAAKFEGSPCADHFGPDGAGHFVKTVHNGIEYADMEMIAEVYGLMRDGLGMAAGEIGAVFARWNEGPLSSYLVEIAATVAETVDAATGRPLLDVILDRAGQKGTGRWTAIEAQHLAAPVTAIEAAVAARNLSARLEERRAGEAIFGAAPERIAGDAGLIPALEQALLAGKIASYAQGFGLLVAASGEYGWAVPLPEVAKVWRAGCIIRSAMLDDMARALSEHPGTNLMFAPSFAERMKASHGALRRVVSVAALSGNPAPALGAALAYFDAMRTGRGTANMIQGQRDFFGLHSFERVDESGSHHGPWARG